MEQLFKAKKPAAKKMRLMDVMENQLSTACNKIIPYNVLRMMTVFKMQTAQMATSYYRQQKRLLILNIY